MDIVVARGSLKATANLVLESKALRSKAVAMTVKWAIWTLMHHTKTQKTLDVVEKLYNDHLNEKQWDDKDRYPDGFAESVRKHLGTDAGSAEQASLPPTRKRKGAAAAAAEKEDDEAAAVDGSAAHVPPPPKRKRKGAAAVPAEAAAEEEDA